MVIIALQNIANRLGGIVSQTAVERTHGLLCPSSLEESKSWWAKVSPRCSVLEESFRHSH